MNSFPTAEWNTGGPLTSMGGRLGELFSDFYASATELWHVEIENAETQHKSQVIQCNYPSASGDRAGLFVFSHASNVNRIRESAVDFLSSEAASSPIRNNMPEMASSNEASALSHVRGRPTRMERLDTSPADFLNYIYLLVREGQAQSASVATIDFLDQLLNDNRFRLCNDVLATADAARMPSALRRAFLMVTRPAKDRLPARTIFYQKSLELLSKERGEEVAKQMLGPVA